MKIEEISDEQMKKAVANVRTSLLKKLPDPKDCQHDFSPEFEQKMELLRKRNKQKLQRKIRIRNIAAILILIFVGAFAWFITNQEAVAGFKKWVLKEKSDQAVVNFNAPSIDSELPEYSFGWLPDGYEVSERKDFPNSRLLLAKKTKGKDIVLEYQIMSEATNISISGESLTKDSIRVGEKEAIFFSDAEKGSANLLLWTEEDIMFMLNSQIDKETMVRIAENVKKS